MIKALLLALSLLTPALLIASETHDTRQITGWTVHVNKQLAKDDAALLGQALKLLQTQLEEIVRVVPAPAVTELKKVPLWINPEYPNSRPRAEYHPGADWLRDSGRDPVMEKAVEFSNVRIFEAETRRMPNFALHELAHAFHDRVLTFQNAEVIAAYESAKAAGKYDNVQRQDSEGRKRLDKAYAMTNTKEYFAETTESFFTRNDFFPFTREELKAHDPKMFEVLGKLWGTTTTATAKTPTADPGKLTLARIFTDEEFKDDKLVAIQWSKKSGSYFTLEAPPEAAKKEETDKAESKDKKAKDQTKPKKDEGKDLVRHDAATGEKTILATAKVMTAEGAKAPLKVDSFEFSPDESQVLLFANTRKVWRRNTRGDYWLLNLANQKLVKLGGDAPASTLMFAKFSPDGTRVAYVQKNNLHVQNLADMKITALTKDGSDKIINGTSDWVNEEELSLRDAFRWSKDGAHLLFWQFDTTDVKRFWLVDQTKSAYQSFTTFPYPKAGQKNSSTRLGVIASTGGAVTWLKIPGDPREHYLPQADWTPDSKQVLLHQFNRLQNTLHVMLADPQTGEVKTILTETDKAWVEDKNSISWIHNDFLWLSERTGWRHAYRVTSKGEMKPLTQGEFDVIDIAKLDERGGTLDYIASPQNGTQRYLYRTSLTGGDSKRLSPADQPGTHSYDISEDAQWAVHTHSTFSTPPVIQLVSLPDHKTVRVLKDQAKLREKLTKLTQPKTEFLRVDIGDGITLDGWCIKPPDFDASRKYPLLMHVYGEPAGQTVKDSWGGQRILWHSMLAQQGYIVASVDTRGTPSPRGRDWRKAIYRQLGILNSAEEAKAVNALLKRFTYLDPKRVGIWGWSGGGSSSLDAIFRYPDLYSTAIAVAPVGDRALYDSIYEERYMGLPKDNADGYRLGSPLAHVKGLQGNLLIIHGTGDDNVHYQGTEKLMNELIAQNKRFTIMPYPNRDHSINTGKGISRHLYELMTNYLHEHLPVN